MEKPRTIVPAPKLALQAPPESTAIAVAELKRTEPIATAKVYPASIAKAILSVTREIGRITKDGKNEFQGYAYVRWDDIAEKLSPLLADHGLILMQTEKSRHLIEQTDKGSTLSIVYGFCFTNEDGDVWPEVEWTALARLRDQKGITDDKAAAKCHTQAEKYFCIKQFKIRTGDAIDSDADGQEHRAEPVRHAVLPKKDAKDIYTKLQAEIDEAGSADYLQRWAKANAERIRVLPVDWRDILRMRYVERLAELRQHDEDGVIWEETEIRPRQARDEIDHTDNGSGVPAFLDRRSRG